MKLAHVEQLAAVKRAAAILEEVREAVSRFRAFAEEAGVPARLLASVATSLGHGSSRPRARAVRKRAR